MDVSDIIGDYGSFLDLVFKNLSEVHIEVKLFDLDHIAYRAITPNSYLDISNRLAGVANLVHQKVIRNRNVDIYKLSEPLTYRDRQICYIEIMAPAEGDNFKEGLEHAEFALKDLNLHKFVEEYNLLNWNTNSIDREIGAEVGLIFKNDANVKFKYQTLAEIIEQEENLK